MDIAGGDLVRKTPYIKLVVHYPQTEQGRLELTQRLADVHADAVVAAINRLDCPLKQKLELLQAVIDTAKGTYQLKASAEPER